MIPSTTIDPYKLRVVVNNVTSNPPLNATSNMRIFSITPSSGNPGTVVTISGQGFGALRGDGALAAFFDPVNLQTKRKHTLLTP